ncbi:MAG: autotransporter assembly complex family protein [Pseudotabrizicola sp.]|uniref:autotransporter assembly complex protein TamA n=1 Tax=Pseudotabrizicola sp. TaxID=2939647 RepID=UPI002730778E|nr:autotransporter assembly complex family protein [Pseudotabrizicola sp.]MDP2081825.1 autotransporter assembly complex family protein [Pseudotabrizicola sp.]MDZ7573885.1 autotransporter assembly complex family protein [Pseudotabrizicola sp.]
MTQSRHPLLRLPFVACLAVALSAGQAGHALDRVLFTVAGANADLGGALRSASALLALSNEEDLPDQVLAAARAEYGRLVGALYAQGHYSPVVSVLLDGREAAGIAPLDAPQRVSRIEVRVDPGPQFRFGQASVSPLATGTELPDGFARGQVAESGLVRQAVTAGVDGWRAQGHAKARVAGQDVVADHPNRTLSARVALEPGPRLRFGPVDVVGNQRTRENRVRKIAGIPQGETYDPADVARAENRLRRTGAFSSVTITEDEGITRPDLLGTTITVVEEKPRRLSFGAEISSLEGLDLSAAWMHRNLLGGAERLRIEGQVSNIGAKDNGVDYSLKLTIDRPATLTPDTTARFATEIGHLDEPDFRADLARLGVGFTHVFSDSLTGRVDLAYSIIDGTEFSEDRVFSTDFRFRSLSLPVGLAWDRRDNKNDAKRGFYIEAEVKPFLGFGTTGSGLRATADLRGYRGFGPDDRFVIAARAQAGIVTGANLLATPRDDLFYSGGGGTVRGQPFQSLGINVSRGLIDYKIGGNHFLAGSLELRTKVTQNIGVVGFVDAGRVDVGGFFDPAGDWHAGAGLGLRYDTGFGPIRLDIAGPVGGTTGRGVQIYVGLGQAF